MMLGTKAQIPFPDSPESSNGMIEKLDQEQPISGALLQATSGMEKSTSICSSSGAASINIKISESDEAGLHLSTVESSSTPATILSSPDDCLPEDILFALTGSIPRPDARHDAHLLPGSKKPANLWNYPIRRAKYKHLTENTVCTCGAGRDISFLYDSADGIKTRVLTTKHSVSSTSVTEDTTGTLIPEEYHIIKAAGAIPLQIEDGKFATKGSQHPYHEVVFPSLKPCSRYEVRLLRETFDKMLAKAGLLDENLMEVKGPSQVHKLIDIIKKEQNIYNIVFHELVRQVSVDCLERGELLAYLRKKYSLLLDQVPRQIMSLYEELLAQRALDRRLGEELARFRDTVQTITGELEEVKQHDHEVTRLSERIENELRLALADAKKNANLLNEYHELYELQRKRLAAQVNELARDKQTWIMATHCLALKAADENKLRTVRTLIASEETWTKLASHFVVIINSQDTYELTQMQDSVEKWRVSFQEFNNLVLSYEKQSLESFQKMLNEFKNMVSRFKAKHFNVKQRLIVPESKDVELMVTHLNAWEKVLGEQIELYTGAAMLTSMETLSKVQEEVENWSRRASQIFENHRKESRSGLYDYSENMAVVMMIVQKVHQQYKLRICGELGAASAVIHLLNKIEPWTIKLTGITGGGQSLTEHEWRKFYSLLCEWQAEVENIITVMQDAQQSVDFSSTEVDIPPVSAQNVVEKTVEWMKSSINAIDSLDARILNEVSVLHEKSLRWIIQVLLWLVPNRIGTSPEATREALMCYTPIEQLLKDALSLSDDISMFQQRIHECSTGVFLELLQRKEDMQCDATEELAELDKFKAETGDFLKQADLVVTDLRSFTGCDRFAELSSGEVSGFTTPKAVSLPGNANEKKKISALDTIDGILTNDGVLASIRVTPPLSVGGISPPVEMKSPTSSAVASPTQMKSPTAAASSNELKEKLLGKGSTKSLGPTQPLSPSALEAKLSQTLDLLQPVQVQELAVEGLNIDDILEPKFLQVDPEKEKDYEPLVALSTLQQQLVESENRAHEAERRASLLNEELLHTQQQLHALQALKQPPITMVTAEEESSPERKDETIPSEMSEPSKSPGKKKAKKSLRKDSSVSKYRKKSTGKK